MEQPLVSPEVVLHQIKQLYAQNGEFLSKKEMKKFHRDLFQNALYYYPSWDHALARALEEQPNH